MEILISQGHAPPANPGGATVVIDVIRAFTTAHYAFLGGVHEIQLVATAEEALRRKQTNPELLLAGEIEALPIDGFDFGNSPYEISQADLVDKTLVQRTTNGVIATLAAQNSSVVLVAALVNAAATARWLLQQDYHNILLVASHPSGDEDVACAEYLRGLLGGTGISLDEAIRRTHQASAAQKFLDGRHPRLRAADIHMAAAEDPSARPLKVNYDPQPSVHPL
ncbi:2-phosphosulfolactate phosphatase [Alcanivorax sp. 1008]|uniref:2-phosphosulfolactate phosphatase n=1 Tax=Alcanivorax sp. 1008 TaxID=2816853 RepID=UPI001D9C4ECA|nr:2-phosphosulfolactate phosphatase [Alcanivorax sp. 1008]MCC1498148.1 2-phosphosulfolactate phosphatase [Alcanivorax sp. 1008]